MRVTFNDELTVKALYKRNADLQRRDEKIRLLRYTPHWAYKRNKKLRYCADWKEKKIKCLKLRSE